MANGLPTAIIDNTVTVTFSFIAPAPGTGVQTTYASHAYYGYCTIADTQYEFTNLAGFKTMSASAIAQEICYACNEIQEALDFSYIMPYAGADQSILGKLREMNAKMAAARLMDRYFTGATPNHSAAAHALRSWVSEQIIAIEHGIVRWDAPTFGDAVARERLPIYSKSALYASRPNTSQNDGSEEPLFQAGRTRFRTDDTF